MADSSWRVDVEEAALVDDQGALPVRMRVQSGIWRPVRAWLEGRRGKGVVRYAVPADYDTSDISRWGWSRLDETDGLLDALIKLQRPQEVLRFAERWGPLYLCRVHYYKPRTYYRRRRCLWSGNVLSGCYWIPAEPVGAWLREAARARAAVRAAALLRQDPPRRVTRELWEAMHVRPALEEGPGSLESLLQGNRALLRRLEPDVADWDLPAGLLSDRFYLQQVINEQLRDRPGHPRLRLTAHLRLTIDPGLGVLRAAWLLVAQVAGRERAIYVCTACGNPYTRPLELRAPKPNQRNYCAECRGGYTIAKKLHNDGRRRILRNLVAFVAARAADRAPDWERVRAEWNEAHPGAAYGTTGGLLTDLRRRTKSYGVKADAIAHLLGED